MLVHSSFGLKYYFKKNYENSFDFKLLPNLVHLGHVGNSLTNAVVLNSVFTIFCLMIKLLSLKNFVMPMSGTTTMTLSQQLQ